MRNLNRFLVISLASGAFALAAGCQKSDDGNTGTTDGGAGAGGNNGQGGSGGNIGGSGGNVGGPGGSGGVGGNPQGGSGGVGGNPQGGSGGVGGNPQGGTGGHTGGTGGMGQGGMGGGACNERGQAGATCSVSNDCCDDGLICIPNMDGADDGLCRTVCDQNADPTGCGPRELCVPNDPNAMPAADMPNPGWCLPGDDCAPGGAMDACGAAASCLAVPPASFCLPAGTAMEGQDCDPQSNDAGMQCAGELACQYGKCLAACDAQGMCPDGQSCIDLTSRLDGLNFKVCHQSCDIFEQTGCDMNQVCAIADSLAMGGVIGNCIGGQGVVAGQGMPGQPCMTTDNGPYWGNCQPSDLCSSLSQDGPDECIAFCHASDPGRCGDGQVCITDVFDGLEGLGLCVGGCDPLGANTCPEGQTCQFQFDGLNAQGMEALSGHCFSPQGGHTVATGEQCEADMTTGDSNCESGNICAVLMEGQPPVCIKLCDSQAADTGCGMGQQCQAVFQFSERFGVCL